MASQASGSEHWGVTICSFQILQHLGGKWSGRVGQQEGGAYSVSETPLPILPTYLLFLVLCGDGEGK